MTFEKNKKSIFIEVTSNTDCSSACTGSGENNTFASRSNDKKRIKNKGERKTCECQ